MTIREIIVKVQQMMTMITLYKSSEQVCGIREHLRRIYWSTRDSHTDILILRIFGAWKDGGSHRDLSGKGVRSSFCWVKLNNKNNSTDQDVICHVTWIKSKVFKIIMKCLYRIVLVSAKYQHKSAIDIHTSPPSWTSLPPPSHPTSLGWYIVLVWVPWVIEQIPIQLKK